MKTCSKCGELKAYEAFYKDRSKDGYRSRCKDCLKQHRVESADKLRAYQAKYYADNADKERARRAKYRADNPDKVRAGRARYRAGGRDPLKPWPPGGITYSAAHNRVQAVHGPASGHVCACGSQAAEWTYQGSCPGEIQAWRDDNRVGKARLISYSPDPSRYAAMCKPCHIRLDQQRAKVSA